MKKIFFRSLILTLALILALSIVSCKKDGENEGNDPSVGGENANVVYSDGLEFQLSDDESYYIVASIGECSDKDIAVPPTHGSLPVKEIGEHAFAFEEITSILLPEGITQIGGSAFYYCSELSDIKLPDSLLIIERYAFAYCESIKNVHLPQGVIMIDNSFAGCYELSEFGVDEDNRSFKAQDGCLYSKDMKTIYCYPAGRTAESFTLPEGVEVVESHCFDGSRLVSIDLPKSLTKIGSSAFYDSQNLKSISLPENLQLLGDSAFALCLSLETIRLPASLELIGNDVFTSCTALKKIEVEDGSSYFSSKDGVLFTADKATLIKYPAARENKSYTIPDEVISIDAGAFYSCQKLQSVCVGKNLEKIDPTAFNFTTSIKNFYANDDCLNFTAVDGVLYSKDMTKLVSYPAAKADKSFSVPAGVTTISACAFLNVQYLESIEIGNDVVAILEKAFQYSAKLKEVVTGDKLEYIDSTVFENCKELTKVILGDSVIGINVYAFWACEKLSFLVLGKGLTAIGGAVFYGCDSLTRVYYTGTEEEWKQINIGSNNGPLLNADMIFEYNNQ